jgi:hypothetical protein
MSRMNSVFEILSNFINLKNTIQETAGKYGYHVTKYAYLAGSRISLSSMQSHKLSLCWVPLDFNVVPKIFRVVPSNTVSFIYACLPVFLITFWNSSDNLWTLCTECQHPSYRKISHRTFNFYLVTLHI